MERRRIVGLLFSLVIATGFWRQTVLGADASSSQVDVTFVYRPKDDPALGKDVEVHSVNLAGSFNDWSRSATPMTDDGSGTYVAHLKLDEGIYHYKFIVNGDTWMQDPASDPDLREDDGHEAFNSGVFVGEQGKDFGTAVSDGINIAAVRHDPGRASYYNVVAADTVEVKLRTLHDNVQRVVLHWRDPGERSIQMLRDDISYGFDYWNASVPIRGTNKTASYYFELTDGATTVNYGANNRARTVEWFKADLTQRFPTPNWAHNVVWYQIFPERFRNGTGENDPPHTLPWRWDWYKMAPGEEAREGGKFSNNWYGRRFGGDFQGVMSELPYNR